MSQPANVFAVKWQNFNLRRFLVFGIILGLVIITPSPAPKTPQATTT